MEHFSEYVARDRMRISEKKREIEKQIAALREQDAELDRELAAFVAFEAALRGSGKGKIGAARREGVIEAIRAVPGIRRAGICDRMGVHTDSGKQAISSTLTALVKEGVVRKEGSRDYFLS